MQAIVYDSFGAAGDVLRVAEIATPDPAPGEVLVALSLSSVNPSDVKARAGTRPGVFKPPFALIVPHSDGVGKIVAVGAGVDTARIGQRVWIWNGQWQRAFGTCASHIALPQDQAVPCPDAIPDEAAAQFGIPGLTAAHVVFAGGDITGKRVLINGAAGTVGYLATQLALWGGAEVIATARGSGADRLRALGVSNVLDYAAPDLAEQILDQTGGPVDHIVEVEFGVNADLIAAVIVENGSICAYGSALNMRPEIPFGPLMFKAITLHTALIYLLPAGQRKAAIDRLHQAFGDGALQVPVQKIFDLADCAAAHRAVEAGQRSGGLLVRTNVS
ncbi:MAG: NADPH:quinone reductase [Paracoccaceae bacterium]